jgi:hypothetical protein
MAFAFFFATASSLGAGLVLVFLSSLAIVFPHVDLSEQAIVRAMNLLRQSTSVAIAQTPAFAFSPTPHSSWPADGCRTPAAICGSQPPDNKISSLA